MPAGPHILRWLEDALSEGFAFHSELDTFFSRVGLAQDRLNNARRRAEARNERWRTAPKRIVVQEILREIGSGTIEDERVMALLIDATCRTTFPNATPQSLEAIEALKRERANDANKMKENRAAFERERETEERKRNDDRDRIARARDAFQTAFLALSSEGQPQRRGYRLESFLNEFMEFEGLAPRGSFKIEGEQIDGAFAWSNRTHLVEAKWISDPVAGAEFGAFDYKLQGKTVDTRGLFVAINGYSRTAVSGLNGKGALRFVCIDGAHLLRSTAPDWSLSKLLSIVWRHADETGEAYLPVGSPNFIARSNRV